MNKKIKKQVFIIFAILITLLVFLLGVWQVSRHFEKKEIIINYHNQLAKLPVEINDLTILDKDQDKYLISKIEARNISENFIYLGPRTVNKELGYNLVALFENRAKQPLLINLGFIKLAQKDNIKLDQNFQQFTLMKRELQERPSIFIPRNEPSAKQWFYLEEEALNENFNVNFNGIYFDLLSENFAAEIMPFKRDRITFFNEHFNYALTWFALTFALICMMIYYLRQENVFSKK